MPGDQPPSEGNFAGHISETLKTSDSFQVVSLEQEAERVGASVADLIALDEMRLRRQVAEQVMKVFARANGVILAALAVLAVVDQVDIAWHVIMPGDRIMTEHVIMTLLGATTVQVGAIAVIVARYLFPGRSVE